VSRWDAHLGELVERRYPALVAYATMLTAGDRPTAEDLVQEAIVRSYARTKGFADVHHAENYVRRAVVSAFVDAHRRRSRLTRAYSRSVEQGAVPGPEPSVVAAVDVRGALAQLSPRERACAVLRFYDDLTVSQIAARLGLADGTVKRYLSDASARLADLLGADVVRDRLGNERRNTVLVTSHRKDRP